MIAWIENLLTGAKGRLIRAGLSTVAGVAAAHFADNQWYLSLSPFLQMVGKTLRDKFPGVWEWLPF